MDRHRALREAVRTAPAPEGTTRLLPDRASLALLPAWAHGADLLEVVILFRRYGLDAAPPDRSHPTFSYQVGARTVKVPSPLAQPVADWDRFERPVGTLSEAPVGGEGVTRPTLEVELAELVWDAASARWETRDGAGTAVDALTTGILRALRAIP